VRSAAGAGPLPDDHPRQPSGGASSISYLVTDGIEAAVALAQQVVGEKNVGVTAGTFARQCLEAGLLDVVIVELVPIVEGKGPALLRRATRGSPTAVG
jgi:dihydrofolate reductase